MAITYHRDLVQGTDEWHNIRLGCVTASNINILITPGGKPAKGEKVRNYAYEIAAQRETRCVEDSFQSFDMFRGHIEEPIARDIYSENFAGVVECGFISNDDLGFMVGCSPDGLVGDNGGIEIKSKKPKFQISTIVEDQVPTEYVNQIQTFLLVSGREWCDYVQYSNGMPLYVKRVFPDFARREIIIDAIGRLESEVFKIRSEYKKKSAGLVKTERVEILTGDEITSSETE